MLHVHFKLFQPEFQAINILVRDIYTQWLNLSYVDLEGTLLLWRVFVVPWYLQLGENLKCPVCCVRGSLASLFSLAPPPLASSVVLKACCSRFKSSQNTKPQLFCSYRPTSIQFLHITELHFFDSKVNWAGRLSPKNSLFSITIGQNGYWRWMSILNRLKHAQHVFSPLCRLKHSCLCTK